MAIRIILSFALCCHSGHAAAVGQAGGLKYSFAGKGSAAAIEQLWRRVLITAAAIPGGGNLSVDENTAIEHAVSSFEFRLVKGCTSGIGRGPVSLL